MRRLTINSSAEMERFASNIGKKLRGGECFELISDLGGGKTTFTRGLVAGSGSSDLVSSPTFTIGKQYLSGRIPIYHYDFYRLQDPGLVAEELSEALSDPSAVIVIEWGQSLQAVLPEGRIKIEIIPQKEGPDIRVLELNFTTDSNYLFEGIL